MRVPDSIVNCVVYICSKQLDGDGKEVLYKHGTGFFLAVGITSDIHLMYLVTAKHLVEDARHMGNICARINTVNGECVPVEFDFDSWKSHPDPGVDIAVLRFRPGSANLLYTFAYSTSAVTPQLLDSWHIGIGSEILITGLFTARSGEKRNLPIIRGGMISAMPGEPFIDPETGSEFDGYLVETRSIGGLSGSPAFVTVPQPEVNVAYGPGDTKRYFVGPHQPQHTILALLGVVRSYYFVKDQRGVSPYTDKEFEKINMGITVVTPITKVLDVLYGPDFLEEQQDMWKKERLKEEEETGLENASAPKASAQPMSREEFENTLKRVSQKTSEPES